MTLLFYPTTILRVLKLLPKILRVHQWVKNLLIFIPLLAAHRIYDEALVMKSLLVFFSFSFVASSVYIINDLVDIKSDRLHPRKKNRPFASGSVSVQTGYFLAPVVLGVGIFLGSMASLSFLQVLGFYFIVTCIYSFWVKRLLLWDVIVLAGLYTLRIFAGSAATQIEISKWLLAFSLFIFLSLAFVKRVSELKANKQKSGEVLPGRGYQALDEEALGSLGSASGYLSVLVFALYVNSSEVTQFYRRPDLLWFICPFILYWISRVWVIARRGQLHDDPIVFALKDKVSYAVCFSVFLVLWLSL